jgi:hypothetical protein
MTQSVPLFTYTTSSTYTDTHAWLEHQVREAHRTDMEDWIIYTSGICVEDGALEARQIVGRPLDIWLRRHLQNVARGLITPQQSLLSDDGSYEVAIMDNRSTWAPLPVSVSFFPTRRVSPPRHITPSTALLLAENNNDSNPLRVVCVIDRLHSKISAEMPHATWMVAAALAMRLPCSSSYFSGGVIADEAT